MITIYRQVDPRDGSVRWVGRTHNLKVRIAEHLYGGKRSNPGKQVWVAELKAVGLLPVVELIEEVKNEIAHERELHWIQFYQAEGEPLLNRSEVHPSARRAGRRSTSLEYAHRWKAWQLDGGPCPFRNQREIKKHIPKPGLLRPLLLEAQLKSTEVVHMMSLEGENNALE